MSDDEVDFELLDLLRQRLGISTTNKDEISSDTGVLRDAEFIYNNSIDVFINMHATKEAAAAIHKSMQERAYSTETWSQHELHPSVEEGFSEVDLVNFVFTLDLLNFSFWSEHDEAERYQVEYRGKRWTGYNSLVACLRRALDEGIAITTPRFWRSRQCSDELLANVFRSATQEQVPLLEGRMAVLRQASDVLRENYPDPDGEDDSDDDLAGLDHDFTTNTNGTEVIETELAGQTCPKNGLVVLDHPQDHNGNGFHDRSLQPLQLDSKAEQPSPMADGLEATVPDDAPGSADSHQSDTPSVDVQTDANASLPHALRLCNTKNTRSESQLTDHTPDHAVVRLIKRADKSSGRLVNLLTTHFPTCFRDEARFDGRKVKLLKRAQIFVADLWAALNARGLGEFSDIDHLTMFPDYRVAQILHGLGVLSYSPPLNYRINDRIQIDSGHSWEVQIRGCSIWAVELLRQEILKSHPEAHVNAVLIDFFLYDLAKEREANGSGDAPPSHKKYLVLRDDGIAWMGPKKLYFSIREVYDEQYRQDT